MDLQTMQEIYASHYIQHSLQRCFKEFGDPGFEAAEKELKQLFDQLFPSGYQGNVS